VFWELGRVHRSQECAEGMTHQDELFFAENATDALDVGNLGTDTESAFQLRHVGVIVGSEPVERSCRFATTALVVAENLVRLCERFQADEGPANRVTRPP